MLAARVDRLPPEHKRLLQTAAVVGLDVPYALLSAVVGPPGRAESPDALRDALAQLQTAELLYETSLYPELKYTFKHALTHEVAYSSLLQKRRRTLHVRLVGAIQALYPDRLGEWVETLANHAFRGELWDEAVAYLRRAGEKATARSANHEAVAWFERALQALEHLPEDPDTLAQAVDLHLAVRHPLLAVGQHERVLHHLRSAEALANRLGDDRRLGWIAAFLSTYFHVLGDLEAAVEDGQRALDAGIVLGDFGLEVEARLRSSWAYHALGDYDRAIELNRALIEGLPGGLAPERFGSVGAASVPAQTWLALALAERGEFVEAIAHGEQGAETAESVGHPWPRVLAGCGLRVAHLRRGDVDRAADLLEQAYRLAQAAEIGVWAPTAGASLGYAYALSGRLAEAVVLLQEAVERTTVPAPLVHAPMWIAYLAEAMLLDGRLDSAAEFARRACGLAEARKQRGDRARLPRLVGEIDSRRDPPRVEDAEGSYVEALMLAEELGMRPLQAHCHRGLGELYGRVGRREQAEAELAVATDLYRSMGMTFWLSRGAPRLPERLERADISVLSQPGPGHLPRPFSSLIGRDGDVAAIRDVLRTGEVPLVTLTGVGGCGKTRLALALASELRDTFADGVWCAELASTSDPSLVPQVIATALGVREVGDASLGDTLVGFLRPRALALVMDNCEHLIEACGALAQRLLSACPGLRIFATSREPLQIAGERRWPVRPLAVPAPQQAASIEELLDCPAVRLFVERAQAVDPGFRLTSVNASAVVQVCTRLGGVPLALELAAARVGVLALEQIAERLDDCLRLLAGTGRARPNRQRTLEAALDWSYELLDESERAAFRRAGVFAGGWDLEAAEAVCGGDGVEPAEALDLLSALVDKSLVLVDRTLQQARYGLLEPVRQYARMRLAASGEADAARARHANHFAAVARWAATELRGPAQIRWLEHLDRERDNLRAMLGWLLERGAGEEGLRLASALAPFWEGRGDFTEGRRWLEAALSASKAGSAPPAARMAALSAAGGLAQWQGALEDADRLLSEALAAARDLGDRPREAELLGSLAAVYRRQRALDRALQMGNESLRLSRQLDDGPGVAYALLNIGVALRFQGEAVRAAPILEESLRRYRQLGDARYVAISLTMLGWGLLDRSDPAAATLHLLEGLTMLRAVGDQGFTVFGLKGLAQVACARREPRRGAAWFAAAEALRSTLGVRLSPSDEARDQRFRDLLRGQLTESELASATAAGRMMAVDEVVEEITRSWPLSDPATTVEPPAPRTPDPLTAREQDVARLLARGYTDRQIADELSIAVSTAGVDVHHILTKLDLHSRWQVADRLAERDTDPRRRRGTG